MNSTWWDSRYSPSEYIFGEKPNTFFAEQLQILPKGSLLLPGEGEGRNAVYAAREGWEVHAFDWSAEAMMKAISMAKKDNVNITYSVQDIFGYTDAPAKYDAIGLIYIHLDPDARESFHKKMVSYLKPEGKIIFCAYSKEQLGRTSGGPQDLDFLYSLDQIAEDFNELEFDLLSQELILLDEGTAHVGEASIIKCVGRKPAA